MACFRRWDGSFLYRVPVNGGVPQLVTRFETTTFGATWTPDGQIIAGSPAGLYRVASDGGEPTPLTSVDAAGGESVHAWPFAIPDRAAVLFVIATGTPVSTGQLAVLALD